VIPQLARAFAIVLLVLIAIKVAAPLVDVAIGPMTALLFVVLLGMWFFDRNNH
jgi:hypothetical protein